MKQGSRRYRLVEMPFWKKDKSQDSGDSANSNGNKADLKQKLAKKNYFAQESPEPVYDLSECGAKAIPSGTFSKCKISLKQGLLLQVSIYRYGTRPLTAMLNPPLYCD